MPKETIYVPCNFATLFQKQRKKWLSLLAVEGFEEKECQKFSKIMLIERTPAILGNSKESPRSFTPQASIHNTIAYCMRKGLLQVEGLVVYGIVATLKWKF